MKGHILMSKKELARISVIEKVLEKRIKQKEAARELRVSERQLRRIIKKYRRFGAESLVYQSRGRVSNNKLCLEEERKIIEIVKKNILISDRRLLVRN